MLKLVHKMINKFADIGRRLKYGRYFKKYGFHKWHMIPKSRKPYIKEIVNYIRRNGIDENTCIVECGCGLCDILADKAFKKCKRVGIEREKKVYDAICEIYRGDVFINGSFQDISGMNIDWFIAVNFTHTISDDEMAVNLNRLVENNHIQCIILDEVTGNYPYNHNYAEIVPKVYGLKDVIGPYPSDGGERYIKIFEKITGKG